MFARGTSPRFVAQLLAIQGIAWAANALLVLAFAPRLLLLNPAVVAASGPLAARCWLLTGVIVLAGTILLARRLCPLMEALSVGAPPDRTADVLSLYALPARLAALHWGATLGVGAVTLAPGYRPASNDLSTQAELLTLAMTMTSVAALPTYVALRASIAVTLERVPIATARMAIYMLDRRSLRAVRLPQRLSAAVAAPVALVALGASLLVQAHLRAFAATSRAVDAAELAASVLDTVDGDAQGRDPAIEAARPLGLDVEVAPGVASFGVSPDDDRTKVTVPLTDGHAVVRFAGAPVGPGAGVYGALAVVAIGIAGALGWRIGRAFADDVRLATRELERAGVADVLGSGIRGDARFHSVAALMTAADRMGAVFREFASAQQRAIEARAATERMRGLFLASMSHDLKAPLNAILGFAELVSGDQLTEGQRESVAIIEQRGRELLYLVDTILDAARVEAGELTVAPEWTRVGDVVMPAVLDARELTSGMQVQISGEIQPGVPRVLVDTSRITQALTAIILVAARFAEKGHVVVRAAMTAAADQLCIDVEGTGRGISASDRGKIFDAFTNADRARRHGSLGLGPSLARAIVELHGGSIDVVATDGSRSEFHVWLPSERGYGGGG
jgi:signal transduction histidine kinase